MLNGKYFIINLSDTKRVQSFSQIKELKSIDLPTAGFLNKHFRILKLKMNFRFRKETFPLTQKIENSICLQLRRLPFQVSTLSLTTTTRIRAAAVLASDVHVCTLVTLPYRSGAACDCNGSLFLVIQ